jgi:RimJ/RimL family protein N-acetyltransferase
MSPVNATGGRVSAFLGRSPDESAAMLLAPVDPVVLTGRTVRLEPMEEPHRSDLAAAAADPALWTWMSVDASTAAGFAQLMTDAQAAQAAGTQLAFVVRRLADERIVGSSRYLNIERVHGRLEIGWTWYERSAWASSVNPEAKRLMLGHAFERLGARRVELRCDARNTRSHGAILRLGAVKEGVLRRHQLVQHGVLRDTALFSILAEEWPAVRDGLDARLAVPARVET